MSSSSYSSMLRDARWQRKRLEIMERDDFTCQSCGVSDKDEGTTLNVHHAYYEKGKKPWEYDGDMLVTLCGECHEMRHARFDVMAKDAILFSDTQAAGLRICACMPELCKLLGEIPAVPRDSLIQIVKDCQGLFDYANEARDGEGGKS